MDHHPSSDNAENVPPIPMTSSKLFDYFVQANTLKQIQSIFYQICITEGIDSTDYANIYPLLRKIDEGKSNSKAEKLWTFLDKRRNFAEYGRQKICKDMNVLIIGAGPCGLRAGIEAALLGAKVIIVEQRDKFSRNNVLHLWEFVIQDLKALGAKIFYPKFCTGSIEHISIRQLQCILTKVALVLGVQIYDGISFSEILEPSGTSNGWKAKFEPHNHLLSEFQFDVLIGADGKRNTLPGFPKQVVRGKLAIGITANFVNKKSAAEEKVQEISGVAYIFNQTFFKDMQAKTGIDLENIVYYKDETHYFVMCAKKQSLLAKGVIKKDNDDISLLLSRENVDQEMLCKYAMQAADFATEGKLPHLEYSMNHRGQCDVAMFDFTALYSALHSTHLIERSNKPLIVTIVGDSLHEPFWPTGSGCARGFLGVFDAAWMLRSFGLNQMSAAEIIAERENVLKLLAQTTKDKMGKGNYTIDPATRYPFVMKSNDLKRILETQMDSDNVEHKNQKLQKWSNAVENFDFDHRCALLKFCQHALSSSKIKICNFKPFGWSDGKALAGLVARFRKDLINFFELSKSPDSNFVINKVISVLEEEYGISKPPLSIFTNENQEDDLIRYIEKVVNHLRRDAGYEAHMISGTLRHPLSSRKRPKAVDASQVPKSEKIQKSANLLADLLKKDAGIGVTVGGQQTPQRPQQVPTTAYNEETIKSFLKSVEEHKASIHDGTLKKSDKKTAAKNEKIPAPSAAYNEETIKSFLKSIEEHKNETLTKYGISKKNTVDPIPTTSYNDETIKAFLISMEEHKSANNDETLKKNTSKSSTKTDSDTLRPTKTPRKEPAATALTETTSEKNDSLKPPQKVPPKETLKLIDDRLYAPPIYPSLAATPEKIIIEKIKDATSPPPNPPPRTVSAKEQAKFDASKAVPRSPVPLPPPRDTSIYKNGFFEFPDGFPSSSQKPSAPYIDEYEALPPPVFSRHTSLSEASKYSTIKDPWIENIPTPIYPSLPKEDFKGIAYPLSSTQNGSKTSNTDQYSTINLLSKPPKVAERVYFTPKAYNSNTVKLSSSSKAQLFKLLNNSSRFNTLPSNFNKQGLSLDDIKKYSNNEIVSSDDETDSECDSDEFELSTLCTDSETESVYFCENVSSEPSSLHTNSDDSDADDNDNEATLKRNTLVASSKGDGIFNDSDYIAFLQSLPKE